MELTTYATLLNQKVLVPANTQPYIAVDRHMFVELMQPFVSQIYVDSGWYLEAYPDVRDAIETGAVESARDHFARFGFFEHRMPYRIEVDESWYLKAYLDVRDAISRRFFTSGQAHFDRVGYQEGRLPYPNFALRRADAHVSDEESERRAA